MINTQLQRGAKGSQVRELQDFLVGKGFLTKEQVATGPGIFGPQTERAVQAFQKAQGIVSSGDPISTGFGRVGPKTLKAIGSFTQPVQVQPQARPKVQPVQPKVQPQTTPIAQPVNKPSVTKESIEKQLRELQERIAREGVTTDTGKVLLAPTEAQTAPSGFNPEVGFPLSLNEMEKQGFDVAPPVAPPVDTTPPVAPPQTPVDATVPSEPDTTPELPPDTATDTTNAFLTSIQTSLDASRKALEDTYKKQLEDLKVQQTAAQTKIDEFTKKQETLIEGDVETALTPFREKLEDAERQRLFINENFQANQRLTNELDTLLTQGNALIEQQRAVTGLASIRDPRVAKTISDVSARVGVIQAVMNARNGQIGQAYDMIDRSVSAINADRQDQLSYYNTLLDFYGEQKGAEEKKLLSITKDQKDFLSAQIGLLESDMASAQLNADNLKEAMTDPNLALAYGEAGVTLNDSPAQIAQKLSSYAYTKEVRATSNEQGKNGYTYLVPGQTAPAGSEVITTTDSKGVTRTWWKVKKAEATPTSFDEWTLAGGEVGTGMTYAQWLQKKTTGKIYTIKDIPGDIRNSIMDDLQDVDYAVSNGELSLEDLIRLYPEVNTETLQELMDQFYDFENLKDQAKSEGKEVKTETPTNLWEAAKKLWWEYWK